MKKLRVLSCLFISLFFTSELFAQTGTVRGFVYDKASGEPLIFTTVYLVGTNYGTSTDNNGIYSISKVPVGNYVIATSSVEYDSIGVNVAIEADRITSQSLYLEKRTVEIEQISISAKREEAQTEVQVSQINITSEQIAQLPSIGGEPDLAQYLQIIPGVIFTGDQGGQLYIRGGTPIQTRVLMDGVTIYNPFHSIGLFSVFETDILRSVDVYTGGFDAEYGERISAIIDIKTRDGNKNRLAGKFSANPFIAKGILEGPIMKLKDEGSSISFILTGKKSYLDKTSRHLYSYVEGGEIPFNFADYYGKISFNASSGSKFSLFGFHFNDQANYRSAKYEWNSLGIGANFVVVPGQSTTIINGTFAYSDYDMVLRESDGRPRNSSIGGFNIRMNFTYFVKDGELKYGFDVNGFKTVFEFFNSLGVQVDQNQNTTELAFFFKYKKNIGKLLIDPSVRISYYASLSEISLEPRLRLKYNATDDLRFKVAGGLYSQNLISGKSDRDVVNLFTSFLSGPEENLTNTNGEEARHKLQKAWHAIAGVEIDITKSVMVNIEPYYKRFTQLININRDKQFPVDSDYMIEDGEAYGLDLLLQYNYKKLFIWAAYSLSYVTANDGEQSYAPHFDRRHNTNFVTSYNFGKKEVKWEVSARWNFGSGFPFTKTQGFYPDYSATFLQQGIQTDYVSANTTNEDDIGILYDDDLNTGRLPYYHRLDFSLKSIISFSKNTSLEIIASITNVYNRENIFYFDRIRYQRVNQLPILPSLGIVFTF